MCLELQLQFQTKCYFWWLLYLFFLFSRKYAPWNRYAACKFEHAAHSLKNHQRKIIYIKDLYCWSKLLLWYKAPKHLDVWDRPKLDNNERKILQYWLHKMTILTGLGGGNSCIVTWSVWEFLIPLPLSVLYKDYKKVWNKFCLSQNEVSYHFWNRFVSLQYSSTVKTFWGPRLISLLITSFHVIRFRWRNYEMSSRTRLTF